MKSLSIITVNLNNAAGLKKTIDSIRSQTFDDYEYIIIDGGSTDESVNVIKINEQFIDKWLSEKDSGIYNAMNKGIGLATGEYCLFLNSGDYLENDEILSKLFNTRPATEIFYGDMIIENKEGRKVYRRSPSKITSLHMLKDTLWHPVSFIHRKLFSEFGKYDESYRVVADYEFFVRVILKKNVSVKHIPLPVSVFNLSGVSSGTDRSQLIKERNRVQDHYFNPLLLFLFRLYSRLRS